jgi:tetratricopeptide (TPR) repeat protein
MRIRYLFQLAFIACILVSCSKEFLDKKSDKSLIIPKTLDDFHELLNNESVMNITPALGEISADNYYLADNSWLSLYTNTEKNAYVWAKDVYQGESVSDWNIPYQQVFYANIILDGLDNIQRDSTNKVTWDNIKGNALFHRAFAFYNLACLFAAPYDPTTSSSDPGIPLRLHADINETVGRGTVANTYMQIINDAKQAALLLPPIPDYKTHASKAATFGLLARVYLNMGQYKEAGQYADSCLQIDDSLMNYNGINTTSRLPFKQFNKEVIYESEIISYGIFYPSLTAIDSTLYQSYDSTDLRKKIFFTIGRSGYPNFKGYYSGRYNLFGGIAVDEMYLVRAECYARQDKVAAALADLNKLLENRYATNNFVPLMTLSAGDALNMILKERRKELVFRELRWQDLRRLNKDPQFAITLRRQEGDQVYTLSPNSPNYVLPIPQNEITEDNIQQNVRE